VKNVAEPGVDVCLLCDLPAAGDRSFCPYCWFKFLQKKLTQKEDTDLELDQLELQAPENKHRKT